MLIKFKNLLTQIKIRLNFIKIKINNFKNSIITWKQKSNDDFLNSEYYDYDTGYVSDEDMKFYKPFFLILIIFGIFTWIITKRHTILRKLFGLKERNADSLAELDAIRNKTKKP